MIDIEAYVTVSQRNTIFKIILAISLLCILICVAGSIRVIPIYNYMEEEITRRSESVFQVFAGKYLDLKLMAVHICILTIVLYSFFTTAFIYYFFEKTQSPEILFIVFFAASFSAEAFRLVIPLGYVYEIPSMYLILSSRIVLFGRFFGLFSLFTASVFAAGYEAQRRNVIVVLIVIALIIALGVPIDTQSWDSSLSMANGYISMFRLIEIGLFLITTISFFIAAWRRGAREFAFIGIGSILVFFGRNVLLSADNWSGLAGLVFLSVGTWLICTKLHKIYLWL